MAMKWLLYIIGLVLAPAAIFFAIFGEVRLSGGEIGSGLALELVALVLAVLAWLCFRPALRPRDGLPSGSHIAKVIAGVLILGVAGFFVGLRWSSANNDLQSQKRYIASALENFQRGDHSTMTSREFEATEKTIRSTGLWVPIAEKQQALEDLNRLKTMKKMVDAAGR
jgi:hypothetical protein